MATVRHLGLLPFCVETGAGTGLGTNYPSGLTAADLLKWYWRVKTWSVAATLTSDNAYAAGTYTYNGSVANNNFLHSTATETSLASEKNLVCRRQTVFSDTDDELSFFLFDLFDSVQLESGLFFPFVSIAFDAGLAGAISHFAVEGVANTDGQFITIDGISVPSYLNGDVTSGSITVTVAEFWPYDPGDGGGAIYDSSTGSQLRPFPA